ncbi:hypothetical protein Taro_051515 [Colocasia esculenta]|uniref:Uncharacterized protein n=1 Tax=Colocasia esculenta TaxID=4460 RepID=A0A843XH25_COLES|nr:hypothetical protein [Colocasia esculenta]
MLCSRTPVSWGAFVAPIFAQRKKIRKEDRKKRNKKIQKGGGLTCRCLHHCTSFGRCFCLALPQREEEEGAEKEGPAAVAPLWARRCRPYCAHRWPLLLPPPAPAAVAIAPAWVGRCRPLLAPPTCWGRVEELLVAGELWIDHKKLILFPLFVCYDQCKPSPWSRPKSSGEESFLIFTTSYAFIII